MKKKIAMALAVGLVLSCLQGCGSTSESSNKNEVSSEQTEPETSEPQVSVGEEAESTIVLEPGNEENESALKHYDPTPEILEATWGDGMVQVADMVFCINHVMSEAEVRAIVEASETGMQLTEIIRNEFDEDPKPEIQPVDKDGNIEYLFEWVWHSVDEQRYYDVAEGEEGWYLKGIYEGADIEVLAGCDLDSFYIDGGIPVHPTPETYNKTMNDLIEEFKSIGAVETDPTKIGEAFYVYLKYEHTEATEIPIGIYSSNGLTIQDNKWSGTINPSGNERFESISYAFRTNKDGTIVAVTCNIITSCEKRKFWDIIERNHK